MNGTVIPIAVDSEPALASLYISEAKIQPRTVHTAGKTIAFATK